MNAAQNHFQKGKAFLAIKNKQKAIREFLKAIKLEPSFADAYYEIGMAYLLSLDNTSAIKYLSRYLNIKPDSPKGHCWLGVAYQGKGMHKEAIKELLTGLHFDPDYSIPHHYLGEIYLEKGEIENAMREFNKAIEIDQHFLSYTFLGKIYMNKKDYDMALSCFKNSIQQFPNNAYTHSQLGKAYQLMGNNEQAIIEYKAALELNPRNLEAKSALEKISKGHEDSDKSREKIVSMFSKILNSFAKLINFYKKKRLFNRILLGLSLIVWFVLVLLGCVIIIPYFILRMILKLRFKELIYAFYGFVPFIAHEIIFRDIRNTARCYYNGRYSELEAQKRIRRLCKINVFQKIIERGLEEEMNLYLYSNAIVAYYSCILLYGKLKSPSAQFQLLLVWIKSAMLAGLPVDAGIFLVSYQEIIEMVTDISQKRELMHYFAYFLIVRGRDIEAIRLLDQVIELYKKEKKNNRVPLADAYGLLGVAYRNTYSFNDAIDAFAKAMNSLSPSDNRDEEIIQDLDVEDLSHTIEFSRNAFNMAITYHDMDNLEKALEYYKLTIKGQRTILASFISAFIDISNIFTNAMAQVLEKNIITSKSKHMDHSTLEAHANGNIGLILIAQGNIDLAIDHLKSALNISEQTVDIQGQRLWNYFLGTVYEEKGELDRAYEYYKRSIELIELIRKELRSNDFFTALDLFEKGFRFRYFTGWTVDKRSWASVERLSAIPKLPKTRDLISNLANSMED